jgi:nitrogen fixation NifU-like protein
MTLKLKGKSRAEALQMLGAFTDVVTAGLHEPPKALGDLKLLAGVRNFPQRVKCAMLAWRAFEQASQQVPVPGSQGGDVSTEKHAPHCA